MGRMISSHGAGVAAPRKFQAANMLPTRKFTYLNKARNAKLTTMLMARNSFFGVSACGALNQDARKIVDRRSEQRARGCKSARRPYRNSSWPPKARSSETSAARNHPSVTTGKKIKNCIELKSIRSDCSARSVVSSTGSHYLKTRVLRHEKGLKRGPGTTKAISQASTIVPPAALHVNAGAARNRCAALPMLFCVR